MNPTLRRVNPTLIIGFVLAIAASALTYRLVSAPKRPASGLVRKQANRGKRHAVIAACDIAANQWITLDLLKSGDTRRTGWTPEQQRVLSDLVGKTTLREIHAGDPVRPEDVTIPTGGAMGHDFQVPPGLRALTVQTASAIAGQPELVRPGDRVDVIVLFSDAHGAQRGKTVAQKVPILSVISSTPVPAPAAGATAGTPPPQPPATPNSPPTVVLGVTPEEAEEIAVGELTGRVRLTIRNPLDQTIYVPVLKVLEAKQGSETSRSRVGSGKLANVVGGVSVPPLPGMYSGPPPKGFTSVEVIRGNERSRLNVPK